MFGKELKKIRESLGLSQSELARRAGLTGAALSQIESSKRGPNFVTLVRLLKVVPIKFEKLAKEELKA